MSTLLRPFIQVLWFTIGCVVWVLFYVAPAVALLGLFFWLTEALFAQLGHLPYFLATGGALATCVLRHKARNTTHKQFETTAGRFDMEVESRYALCHTYALHFCAIVFLRAATLDAGLDLTHALLVAVGAAVILRFLIPTADRLDLRITREDGKQTFLKMRFFFFSCSNIRNIEFLPERPDDAALPYWGDPIRICPHEENAFAIEYSDDIYRTRLILTTDSDGSGRSGELEVRYCWQGGDTEYAHMSYKPRQLPIPQVS